MNLASQSPSGYLRRPRHPLNQHLQASMAHAQLVLDQLVADGFTVLKIVVGLRNPIITIANCPKVATLEGACKITHRGGNVQERLMVAVRDGVQVEWVEKGH
jgi:hypothetical protein